MTCALLGMAFTFFMTVAGVGFLVWLGLRRLMAHFQGNADATRSFVDNVLQPLFGPKSGEEVKKPEKPAEVKKVKGTLV